MSARLSKRSLSVSPRGADRRSRLGKALSPVLRTLLGGATAVATLGIVQPAGAQVAPTNTWTGTSSSNWSTGTWTPAVPVSGVSTILQFNNNAANFYSATNDIANPFQLNGL